MTKKEYINNCQTDAENYINKCWSFRHHYRKEEEKILYFAGTLFTTIVATTGILDAYNKINLDTLTIYHLIVFHSLFFILLLFYLYKQLNTDIFNYMASQGERFLDLNIRQDIIENTSLPAFSDIKVEYFDNKERKLNGIILMRVANYLIVFMYMFITIFPFFLQAKADANSFTLPYKAVITAFAFIMCLLLAFYLKNIQKKRAYKEINIDWEKEYEKFISKSKEMN